ncbi:MAG TPA: hypothetical protein VFN87_11700 [Solirubrobacteraceae bacterium]|nr:hypothetical protein [Solirubrobacteraceae bacterium]
MALRIVVCGEADNRTRHSAPGGRGQPTCGRRSQCSRARSYWHLTDGAGCAWPGLPRAAGEVYWPAWSPDGTQIVFSTAHYDKSKQQTGQCITVMHADGSGRREITRRNPDFWAASPSWRPGV